MECAYTSPVNIESGMLVTCCMQCTITVSLLISGGAILASNYECSYISWLNASCDRPACLIELRIQ